MGRNPVCKRAPASAGGQLEGRATDAEPSSASSMTLSAHRPGHGRPRHEPWADAAGRHRLRSEQAGGGGRRHQPVTGVATGEGFGPRRTRYPQGREAEPLPLHSVRAGRETPSDRFESERSREPAARRQVRAGHLGDRWRAGRKLSAPGPPAARRGNTSLELEHRTGSPARSRDWHQTPGAGEDRVSTRWPPTPGLAPPGARRWVLAERVTASAASPGGDTRLGSTEDRQGPAPADGRTLRRPAAGQDHDPAARGLGHHAPPAIDASAPAAVGRRTPGVERPARRKDGGKRGASAPSPSPLETWSPEGPRHDLARFFSETSVEGKVGARSAWASQP
jgi:hypothetical protein